MKEFNVALKELIDLEKVNVNDIAVALDMKDASMINYWLRGDCVPSFKYSIMLANYFNISLDYLFGRSEDVSENVYKTPPPFNLHIKKILKDKKVSQYKLIKDKVIQPNTFHSWCTQLNLPKMKTLIKLADYLNISLDHLVGRE